MITRSEWGADSVPPREPAIYGEVQLAFVHHTVTANDYGPEDSAGIVLGIARYHRNGNGWNDIGYNFLVDKYGQIFEGRGGGIDQPVVGAQAQGYNSVSTGVACLGTFTSVAQSPAGLDALARVIGWKLTLHAVPTQGTITVTSAGGESNRYPSGTPVTFERISGHRNGNNTSCPGDTLYGQLADLRAAAARYAGPTAGLTVYAPGSVRGLRQTDVSGYLRFPDGSAAAGAPIAVQFLLSTSEEWTTLTSVVCGADGSWRAPVELRASGRLRAVFAGDRTRARMESAPRTVAVIPQLNIKLGRSRMRGGQTVEVSGTASPATHVRLTLDRRLRRRWAPERRRLLRVRAGAYRVRLRPLAHGKYRVTVQVGGIKRRRALRVL
jgi:hypothetical protein